MGRGLRLRTVLLLLGIAVIIGLIGWAWTGIRCRRALHDQTVLSADNIARSIALFGTDRVISRDWRTLQQYADTLVREKPFAYIAIVDMDGTAVVHTDRGLQGRSFSESRYRGTVQAFTPVMRGTRQIATVRVGLRPDAAR